MSRIPTVEELLALPYGKTTRSDTPSVDELLELPYVDQSSAAQGFIGEHNRREMRNYGQPVRWFRCLDDSRTRFAEQYLDESVRVFLNSNRKDVQGQGFGDIAVGDSQIGYMPDEIQAVRNDRFLRELDTLAIPFTQVLEPSGNATDRLLHRFIYRVREVRLMSGEALRPSSYSLDHGYIRWYGAPPTQELSIAGEYKQLFEMLGEGVRRGHEGQDGVALPTFAELRELDGAEEWKANYV